MSSAARIFGHGRFVGVEGTPGAKKKAAASAPKPVGAHRRRLLATVHIAVKEIGLSDADYRSIVFEIAGADAVTKSGKDKGKISAGNCTDAQLAAVIERFRSRGWKPAQATGPAKPKPADHKPAGKARALWISLHALGAIENPSEQALEAFARRQLGCARMQWMDQGLSYRLIEALKAMAERHGWSQALDGVKPEARVIVLKRRLVEALMGKLWQAGSIPLDWDVKRAASTFAGMDIDLILATGSELDIVARELGRVLRETTGGKA